MTTCKQDDDKICMSAPDHDCQNCSIAGRKQIKRNNVSGFRHVHGRAFIEAFDRAYKLN